MLENSKDLDSEGVKNGTQVMAVILTDNVNELQVRSVINKKGKKKTYLRVY